VRFLQEYCGLCGGVNPYAAVAGTVPATSGVGGRLGSRSASAKRTTWTYSDNQNAWNYFDTDALPHGLKINS